jgi:hypothetical protein
VVVAVIAVRMVQVAVDEIVDVMPMRHRFMAAPGSVNVARLVAAAARRALVRILGAHFELVLVYVIGVRMMQMTIMQIINVTVVLDRSMPTVRAMLMVVVRCRCSCQCSVVEAQPSVAMAKRTTSRKERLGRTVVRGRCGPQWFSCSLP